MISTTNTCLFQIDLDIEQFDEELATTVVTESALNRDIQEKLKPQKIVKHVGPNGEILSQAQVNSSLEQRRMERESVSSAISDKLPASQENKQGSVDMLERSRASASQASISQADTNTETTQVLSLSKLHDKKNTLSQRSRMSQPDLDALPPGTSTIVEVKFADDASVSECFQSAIKAWRIYQPNMINLEN